MLRSKRARQLQESAGEGLLLAPPEDLVLADPLVDQIEAPEELMLPHEVLVLPNPDVLVLPKPRKSRAKKAKAVPQMEDLLAPDPAATQTNQRCLAMMMQSAGHSLDLGCRLCFTNCVYATPCGCKGYDCIDRQVQEPLVVFTETVHASPRGWKKMFQRRSDAEPSGLAKVVRKLFRPWTWFWGDK